MAKILGILPHSIGGRLTTSSILDGFKQNGFKVVLFDELKDKFKLEDAQSLKGSMLTKKYVKNLVEGE